jgi:VWFA-related protein
MIPAALLLLASGLLNGQKKGQTPVSSGAVIRTETKLVVVDVVATDRKGIPVRGLEAKDFRVWEDNKEQVISSFSFGTEPGSSATPTRYLLLFFDSLNLNASDQTRAKQSAIQFIQAFAGPTRRIAVADFDNNLRIAQDFSENVERLTNAVKSVRASTGTGIFPNQSTSQPGTTGRGAPQAQNSTTQSFTSRNLVASMRSLAKNLNTVPGRKTVIWFSGGFPVENSELETLIEALNRSNVGVFPVDVRGVGGQGPFALQRKPSANPGSLLTSLFARSFTPAGSMSFFQQGGTTGGGAAGGGTTGGGAAGGGATGGSGGSTGGATPGGGTSPGTTNPGGATGGRGTTSNPTTEGIRILSGLMLA